MIHTRGGKSCDSQSVTWSAPCLIRAWPEGSPSDRRRSQSESRVGGDWVNKPECCAGTETGCGCEADRWVYCAIVYVMWAPLWWDFTPVRMQHLVDRWAYMCRLLLHRSAAWKLNLASSGGGWACCTLQSFYITPCTVQSDYNLPSATMRASLSNWLAGPYMTELSIGSKAGHTLYNLYTSFYRFTQAQVL